jgi:hypothetical protein
LLAATGTSKVEESDDSSASSAAQAWDNLDLQVGNLDLVHQTLQGIAIRNQEEGEKALGRHARTIRLGRSLWQSEPLSPEVVSGMSESVFDENCFPPLKEMRNTIANMKKKSEERPAPFAHETQPYATLSVVHYGERLHAWMQRLQLETEAPTTEQFELLKTVCNRILLEFRITKEGLDLPKKKP